MDDYAKSAFLWAERILEEREKMGICCAVLSVIDPLPSTGLWTKDIVEIFLPFAELYDGYYWDYSYETPTRFWESINYYWFFPRESFAPRKQLIHCLLSHSPL